MSKKKGTNKANIRLYGPDARTLNLEPEAKNKQTKMSCNESNQSTIVGNDWLKRKIERVKL